MVTTGKTAEQQPPHQQHQESGGSKNNNNLDARFSCNICFDSVVEPVVTQCGHLYCWPCLYRWLEPGMYPEERASLGLMTTTMTSGFGNSTTSLFDTTRRVCPVCKSTCTVPTLVPIYVRSTNETTSLVNNNNNGHNHDTASRPAGEQRMEQPAESKDEDPPDSSLDTDQFQDDQQQQQQPQSTETTTHEANLGLRQRRNRQGPADTSTTTSSNSNSQSRQQQVPNRPAASSPMHESNRQPAAGNAAGNPQQHTAASTTGGNNWLSPMSPNGRHGSLTHGILMGFHQVAVNAQSENNNNNADSDADAVAAGGGQRTIPSLHDIRDGSLEGTFQQQQQQPIDVNAETMQYLSRLLIMLTSFVVLCLLLL